MPRVLIALLITALPATALTQEETLDPNFADDVAGTYSLDCADPDADHLMVFIDKLVFSGADEEIVAAGVMSAFSYYGRMPPEGFEVALLGVGGPLTFEVYSDEQGRYILAEGYPEDFGRGESSDEEYRFYRCPSED